MKRNLVGRAKTLFVYVLAFHVIRTLSDLILPNADIFNRIRGALLGPFIGKHGQGLAIATGLIANGIWNLRLGRDVYLAHNCWLNATGGLTISDGAIISPNVVIATTAHKRENAKVSLRQSSQAPIFIGRGVWIASNCVITRGVNIGDGAVVAAGSVVYGDVPAHTLFRGNPAVWIKDLRG